MLDPAWATPSIRAALSSGSYEQAERGVLGTTLSPNDTYLELGSGIGVLATLAARRVGSENVVAIDADPAIAAVARETAALNGHAIDVRNVVLLHGPEEATASFYVSPDFRVSSLCPPSAGKNGSAPLRRLQVPTVDAYATIAGIAATYLMVDIEGAEMHLLRSPLPDCVRTICVELHTEAAGIDTQSEMLAALLNGGFQLDIGRSDLPVLLFTRRGI